MTHSSRPRRSAPLRVLALALAIAPAALPGTAVAKPMALVIGEGAYVKLPKLKSPAADAWSMGDVLKSMGYKVTAYGDLGGAQLTMALDDFAKNAEGAEGLVVYFSGHGARVGGKSYLLPVDAAPGAALAKEGISIADLTAKLAKAGRPLVLLIDAGTGPVPEGASGPGLAKPALPKGAPVMIAMAAQPGKAPVAATGDFSAFTLSLLTYLPLPGMPVSTTMRWISRDVKAATGGRQDPLVESALAADYALSPGAPPDMPAEVALPKVAGGTAMFAVMKRGKAPEPTVASAAKPAPVPAPATSPTLAPAVSPAPAPAPAAPDAGTEMAALAPSAPAGAESAPTIGQPEQGDAQVAALAPSPRPTAPSADSAPSPDAAAPNNFASLPKVTPPANPAPSPTAPVPAPSTQLAALPAPKPLSPVTPDALHPQGSVVMPDGTRVPMLEGGDLVRAIQTELKRVNCYNGGIDGDFGPGSRGALKRFLDQKNLPGDNLDPTFDIYAQLIQSSGQVCADRTPVRTSAPARSASTPSRTTSSAPAPAAKPAPAPANGNRKIKIKGGLMPNF